MTREFPTAFTVPNGLYGVEASNRFVGAGSSVLGSTVLSTVAPSERA